MFNSSINGIVMNDLDGRFIYANSAFLKMAGCGDEKDLMGKFPSEISQDRDRTRQIALEVREKGSWHGEDVILRKDGSLVNVEISISLIRDKKGNPSCSMASLVDITERKRMEKKLQESEMKYRELIDAAPDAIFVADVETGRILDTNRKAETLLSRTRGEILSMHQSEVHPKEEAERYMAVFKEHVQRGEGATMELFVVDKYGKKIPVSISSKVIEIADRKIIQGVFRDITEQKLWEKALIESEKKFRQIVETSTEGIWLLDLKANTTYVNRQMEEMLGYGQDEMIGRPLFAFMDEEARAEAKQLFERRKQGVAEKHDFRFLRKDGSVLWAFVSTNPLKDEHGRFKGAIGMLTDISGRKLAEEEIKRSLREKEVMLKEIHHRVKNNMEVICSLLDLQAKQVADKSVHAAFMESMNRVNSMALVHEKLYRSADLAHIDFKEYLQSLVSVIANTYNMPDVNFSVDMEPVFLDVNIGIPCGLIVNELVSNCFKHAFPDRRKGAIRLGINGGGDAYALLVADNGIGLPEGMDFRNTTSLGLQLVNVLVRQMRGTIELSRKQGTAFTIIFPSVTKNRNESDE